MSDFQFAIKLETIHIQIIAVTLNLDIIDEVKIKSNLMKLLTTVPTCLIVGIFLGDIFGYLIFFSEHSL